MERENCLIDTNIAIYYYGLALSKKSESFIDKLVTSSYYLSVINRIELLGYKKLTTVEKEAFDSFIEHAHVIELEEQIILQTIEIRKEHSIKLPDAMIAATCLVHNLALVSHNIKDFEKIKKLHTVKLTLL